MSKKDDDKWNGIDIDTLLNGHTTNGKKTIGDAGKDMVDVVKLTGVMLFVLGVGYVSFHVIKFVWAVIDTIFPVGKW